jgi:membrane-associated phospholipid phosphatase
VRKNSVSIIIISILLIFTVEAEAQSPYEMNMKKDGAIILIGLPVVAVGIALDRSIAPLTLDEVNKLDRNDIFKPDRFVSYNYSEKAGALSDILVISCVASPLLLLSSKSIRNDAGIIAGMYLQSLIFGIAIPAYGKGGLQRVRPYAYNPDAPLDMKLTSEAKRSFISGHTSMAFTSMVFLSTVYSTYYPDSNARPYIWAGSLLLASTVGYLRIAAGSHFLTDVIVGAIAGAAVGYLIPKWHETDVSESEIMQSQQSTRAPLISFQFAL